MTQSNAYNIALIGCGKMGAALIQGWVKAKLIKRATLIDPNAPDESLLTHNVFHVKQIEDIPQDTLDALDMIILAVKPQIMDGVCESLKDIIPSTLPILSIAAGKSLGFYESLLGQNTPIIRAMPNTPAAVQKAMSAMIANANCTPLHKAIVDDLMNAVGKSLWVDHEGQMDAITAVAGSGPAYLFYFIEALTKAAEHIGLSAEHAALLARQTVIGSSALAEHEAATSPATLRQNVTSPGGTTAAGLEKLMDRRLEEVLTETVLAAQKRSKDLSS